MKTFTFTISLVLISLVNFAQSPVCANYFRRNNGNGSCPDGQLKLYFATCPTNAPVIDSVYTNGVKANITFDLPDASKCASKGYIAYCIDGGNMPPASLWTIFFHNATSLEIFSCTVPENDPFGILPIALNSFFAKRNGNSVLLNWQTSFESNAHGFEIQRKSDNGFITVGTVLATNSSTGNSYSFTDNNTLKVVSEYRLKLISKDADITYSQIRSIKGTGSAVAFTIFPNPAVRNARISITDINESTDIQVIDNAGRLIKTISSKTSNNLELNGLQTGIYRIRLLNKSTGEAITKTLTIIQ